VTVDEYEQALESNLQHQHPRVHSGLGGESALVRGGQFRLESRPSGVYWSKPRSRPFRQMPLDIARRSWRPQVRSTEKAGVGAAGGALTRGRGLMRATRLPIPISRNELALAIGLGCAVLPAPALAQTATSVNDQIKQLQGEIRNIQKHYETEIRRLQRQLDDLKCISSDLT
jgi:hypothetical protein